MNNLTPEEINALAVTVASILAKDADKKEIISLKFFLSLLINNLATYLLE